MIGQTVAELWQFIGFQKACRPPSLIFKIRICLQFIGLRCPICLIFPNFISVAQSITDISLWWFFIFKMAAVGHLGFLKFITCYDSEIQRSSSCQILCQSDNPLRRYGHFSIFQEGRRPPYWICYRHIGTTHEEYSVVSTLYHYAKFGWNPCSYSFDNVDVSIFCVFGLKTPIHAPKMFFFGVWPLNCKMYHRDPKRH